MPIPHPNWEDIDSNSREQLIQMLKDLEIPYFSSATNKELKQIISARLNPKDQIAQQNVKKIFTETRYKQRAKVTQKTMRFTGFLLAFTIFLIFANRFTSPLPYCTAGEKPEIHKCRPCPDSATCTKQKAKCPKYEFLSPLGCRPYETKKMVKHALRASRYIARRDADCIDSPEDLTVDSFHILFPDINISIFETEKDLNIIIDNGTVHSTKPKPSIVCLAIQLMDNNPNIIGPIVLVITSICIYYIALRIKRKNIEEAKDLAKLAHKILATTDKQIYIYDMKVQLRAKNPHIDRLWKTVVKYIENDSHVIVGVMGARHEVYWKWIHHE